MHRVWFIALVLGCASSPTSGNDAQLELGTGTFRYEPLEDGAEVPLVHGAQGGWHVWLSVRASGIDEETGSLLIEMQRADESVPPQNVRVGIRFDPPNADGMRDYLGWPAIMSDPSCAVGHLYRIRATFTTSRGERLTAERYLIPAPGDDPPPPCGGLLNQ
jgi:hypothetical protein